MRVQQKDNGNLLAAYARFLEKTQTKSLGQRKNLWLLLVSKEGLAVAEEAGARLNVDDDILAAWIEEWLQDDSHTLVAL